MVGWLLVSVAEHGHAQRMRLLKSLFSGSYSFPQRPPTPPGSLLTVQLSAPAVTDSVQSHEVQQQAGFQDEHLPITSADIAGSGEEPSQDRWHYRGTVI